MADFSITLATDYLGVKVTPLRADGTPGTILPGGELSYNSSDPTVASVHEQPGDVPPGFDECRVVPLKDGTVTITATGKDENGEAVTSSFTVAVVGDPNPTAKYTFTQIHP